MDEASRRLAVLERQCCAGPGPGSSGDAQRGSCASSSYASATSTPSSYARVHGEVSREPAHWRQIQNVAQQQLEEVKYEKSDEGIAKVVNVVLCYCSATAVVAAVDTTATISCLCPADNYQPP